MQRHELAAWLGDDHRLTDGQITHLLTIADDIARRYPDSDDEEKRTAALDAAYRLMVEDSQEVVDDLADTLARARIAEAEALAGLRQVAITIVRSGDRSARGITSQQGFAVAAGVDRQTVVRDWLGARTR